MRFLYGLTIAMALAAPAKTTSLFPVKSEQGAISIAAHVCRGKADKSLRWMANLDRRHRVWVASTTPIMCRKDDRLLVVEIPVNGPYPDECLEGFDNTIGPPPCPDN